MKDSVIVGIVIAAVVVLASIVAVLYIIISYRVWKRSTDEERRKYCLNRIYRRRMENRERKKVNDQNKRNFTIEGTRGGNEAGCDNKIFTTIGYSNRQDEVVIDPANVTLEVASSPIRKSAETYSFVDLNDDS